MIYVDEIVNYGEQGKRCHCWADNEAELRRFGALLHLPSAWIHRSFSALLHQSFPHYDLSPRYRRRALAAGAKPTTLQTWLRQRINQPANGEKP